MKLRWKIAVAVVATGMLVAFLLWGRGNRAQDTVAETRRALRQQGFKTDLSEFNFSISAEMRARATALTK